MPNAFGTLELPPGSPISYSCPQTSTLDLEANPWPLLAKRIHEVAVQIEDSSDEDLIQVSKQKRSCCSHNREIMPMNGTPMILLTSMDPMESMRRSWRPLDLSRTWLGRDYWGKWILPMHLNDHAHVPHLMHTLMLVQFIIHTCCVIYL